MKKKKIVISLSLKACKQQRVNIADEHVKGLFLWIGSGNVVDRIVGFHKKRGFIADYCYNTGNFWLKDLFLSLFKWKDGFVRITRFI